RRRRLSTRFPYTTLFRSKKGGADTSIGPGEPALRIIMRRLREIMAEQHADGQARLDKIVRQIAGLMVAEVCSIYLKRQDGTLERSEEHTSELQSRANLVC